MEKLLDSVYYNTKSPACYAGIQAVYREAKARNANIRLSDVRDYLHKQYTYTIHKPIRRKFARGKIKAVFLDSHWQADLCDLQKLAKYNDGYKYLLTCFDVFSKYGWAEPIKDKQASTVATAFSRILKKGRKPFWLMTDKGKEFVGKAFRDLMTKKMVTHYTAKSPDIKAASVERYNRTLKSRLWRYFTEKKTFRYLNILPTIVQSINSCYTSTIGCRPIDVTMQNEGEIRQRMYAKLYGKTISEYKFNVGDRVRIAKEKTLFRKGYLPNFTEEIFVVVKRIPRKPAAVYELKDLHGEDIEGIFYPEELVQAVSRRTRPCRFR